MDSDQRCIRIHDLEMKHQNHIHRANVIAKDEESRRHRLRAVLLRDEKSALHDQLVQKDSRIKSLTTRCEQIQAELAATKETSRRQDQQLKAQARDFAILQTELQSLNTVSQDSTKLLVDKLALSRELNTLKPEVDHLRSQLSHQQSVVAEKLALERQLNSVEVELEAQKRSKHRTLHCEDKDSQADLRAKVKDLEKKLAAEKKDKERVRKEGERALAEATAQTESLEQRLEGMKLKLRDVRDELKKTQAESSFEKTVNFSEPIEKALVPRKQGRKRRAEEPTEELTIYSPVNVEQRTKRPLKKKTFEPKLVGEKSTFSITPFLNRTKNVGDESALEATPTQAVASNRSALKDVFQFTHGSAPAGESVTMPVTQAPKSAKRALKARGRPRKILGALSASKDNTAPVLSLPERTQTIRFDLCLDKVMEEAHEEDQENQPQSQTQASVAASDEATQKLTSPDLKLKSPTTSNKTRKSGDSSTGSLEPEPRKKKRKLTGGATKTLFDDEGVEAPKRQKVALGARPLGRAALGAIKDAFGGVTFSPLKRDRRGVHASFLA